MSERGDRVVGVVHSEEDAAVLELEDFGCFDLAVITLEDDRDGSWFADDLDGRSFEYFYFIQKRFSTEVLPCPSRDTDHRKRDDR